jgi:hypothetical protein
VDSRKGREVDLFFLFNKESLNKADLDTYSKVSNFSFGLKLFKTGKFLPKNEKNIKSTAFLVARSIARFGYQNKPKNFVEVSYQKILNNTQIKELIAEATFDDLLNLIEGL